MATKKKIEGLEVRNVQRAAEEKVQNDLLAKNLDTLSSVSVTIHEKVNEKEHLFKGIHREEIQKALFDQAHIQLPLDSIQLNEPIKKAGEYDIQSR